MERGEETLLRSSEWRKALEGEAQECRELKEASRVIGIKRLIERVAKPENGTS